MKVRTMKRCGIMIALILVALTIINGWVRYWEDELFAQGMQLQPWVENVLLGVNLAGIGMCLFFGAWAWIVAKFSGEDSSLKMQRVTLKCLLILFIGLITCQWGYWMSGQIQRISPDSGTEVDGKLYYVDVVPIWLDDPEYHFYELHHPYAMEKESSFIWGTWKMNQFLEE